MNGDTPPADGLLYVEPRQQRQWDAFFKRLAPHSDVIRSIVEKALEMEGRLGFGRMLPSDLQSARVAAALHMDEKFKELRPDGIYVTADGKSSVNIEYQSTYNAGMFIRFVMYAEAFIEHKRDHKISGSPHCVLLYSGRDHSIWKKELHGQKHFKYVKFVFVNLEAMASEAFDGDELEGRIIGLSRPLATNVGKFDEVMDELVRLSDAADKDDIGQDRLAMLKTALVLAGVNKPDVRDWVLGRMRVDEELRLGLAVLLPELQRELINDANRRADDRVRKADEAARLASVREQEAVGAISRANEAEQAANRFLRLAGDRLAQLTADPDGWRRRLDNAADAEVTFLIEELEQSVPRRGLSPT